jgi:very-short-patch-repair endonuclease
MPNELARERGGTDVEREMNNPLSRLRERVGVRARTLRRDATDAERALWRELRDRRLGGYKFRRQHPIDAYIADFVCIETKLVIEVDGGQHMEPVNARADAARTRHLEGLGFTVLRFDNRQVLMERAAVLGRIHEWLLGRDPHPSPLPQAGEGAIQSRPAPTAGEGVDKETP